MIQMADRLRAMAAAADAAAQDFTAMPLKDAQLHALAGDYATHASSLRDQMREFLPGTERAQQLFVDSEKFKVDNQAAMESCVEEASKKPSRKCAALTKAAADLGEAAAPALVKLQSLADDPGTKARLDALESRGAELAKRLEARCAP